MFDLKKYLTENKITKVSEIDEAYGKPLAIADIHSQAMGEIQNVVETLRSYMVKYGSEVDKLDQKAVKAYRDVQNAGKDLHRRINEWKHVMEGIEKVKHQQRGK